MHETVSFPGDMSPQAVSLVEGLLAKVPGERLGSGAGDVNDVMGHEFFSGIDWSALVKKEVESILSLTRSNLWY